MTDYKKLAEYLRRCGDENTVCTDEKHCPYGFVEECEFALMNDAAAAIEELKATVSKQESEKMALYRDTIFHKKRIEYLESQIPRWISVKDRLPNRGEHVLVLGGEFVFIDCLRDNEWASSWIVETRITHWMPLPSTEVLK